MVEKKLFCVTSIDSVGCTFLDWSLHWLSGTNQTFYVKEEKWVDIVDDPLQSHSVSNAHKHKKNQQSGRDANKKIVESLLSSEGFGGRSFYPFPLWLDLCCDQLGIPIAELKNTNTKKTVDNFQKQDYIELLEWISQEKKIPCVFVSFDRSVIGYRWQKRSLERFVTSRDRPKNIDELNDEYQQLYFSNSINAWKSLGLTEVWDTRERMALDIRPFESTVYDDFCLPFAHHWVNCQDLWFDTERCVRQIMDFLGLELQSRRLQSWLPVSRRWQTMQNDAK